MARLSPTVRPLDDSRRKSRPTAIQLAWLRRGLDQPGGKLPLFDRYGRQYDSRTIRTCIEHGWAEPWFKNPVKPDWLVCKLTAAGRIIAGGEPPSDAAEAVDEQPARSREKELRDLVDDLFA